MKYKKLGNTGLTVSRIGFGNWINSGIKDAQSIANELVKVAWDLGINFFDTAEVYTSGEAEKQFGLAIKALNARRQDLVISTKLFWGPKAVNSKNCVGTNRKHIIEGINDSLKRLQLDYVDIVFAHRCDYYTDMEETCKAFDQIIRDGKAFYWGTSMWEAQQIFEAFMICEKFNLHKPVTEQCIYNMLNREKMEVEYQFLFDKYNYGSTIWSPLAEGLLTGKYKNGIPDDARFGKDLGTFNANKQKSIQNYFKDGLDSQKFQHIMEGLSNISDKLKCTQSQLAMAWVLKYDNVSSAITGATKIEQIQETVKAFEVLDKLTPEILEEIEKVINTRPKQLMDYVNWQSFPDRR